MGSKGLEYCIRKCLSGLEGYGVLVWTPLREVQVEKLQRGKPNIFYVDYYFYPKAGSSKSRIFLMKLKLPGKVTELEPPKNTIILSPDHMDPSIILGEVHNLYREVKAKVDQLYMELAMIPRRKRDERRSKRVEIASYEILLEIMKNILHEPEKLEAHTAKLGKTIWAPIIIAKPFQEQDEGEESYPVVCQAYGKIRIDKAYTYAAKLDENIRNEYEKLLQRQKGFKSLKPEHDGQLRL